MSIFQEGSGRQKKKMVLKNLVSTSARIVDDIRKTGKLPVHVLGN